MTDTDRAQMLARAQKFFATTQPPLGDPENGDEGVIEILAQDVIALVADAEQRQQEIERYREALRAIADNGIAPEPVGLFHTCTEGARLAQVALAALSPAATTEEPVASERAQEKERTT